MGRVMERTCENCKYSCVDSAIAATFCMGQKNMPRVRPFDTCKDWRSMYKTNADKIRAMTDEELVDGFLFGISARVCPSEEMMRKCDRKSCRECWLDWLKQEVRG